MVRISAVPDSEMARPDFAQRLERIKREGNLTTADLARWFNRPHPTVSGWCRGGPIGRELAPLDAAYVTAQLARLEKWLNKGPLPVPVGLSKANRRRYFDQLRNGRPS